MSSNSSSSSSRSNRRTPVPSRPRPRPQLRIQMQMELSRLLHHLLHCPSQRLTVRLLRSVSVTYRRTKFDPNKKCNEKKIKTKNRQTKNDKIRFNCKSFFFAFISFICDSGFMFVRKKRYLDRELPDKLDLFYPESRLYFVVGRLREAFGQFDCSETDRITGSAHTFAYGAHCHQIVLLTFRYQL